RFTGGNFLLVVARVPRMVSTPASSRQVQEFANSGRSVATALISFPHAGAAGVLVGRDTEILCERSIAGYIGEAARDDDQVATEQPADSGSAHQDSGALHQCGLTTDQSLQFVGKRVDLRLEMSDRGVKRFIGHGSLDGLASERGARVRRSGLLMYQLLTRAENDANLLDDHLLRLPEAEFVGIPKAILSDPATVERVVLGQTIAERFPDGPRVEKRERILLSVELIGDKLAVDARVLDAEVDLAQVNVFTAEPGFEAS